MQYDKEELISNFTLLKGPELWKQEELLTRTYHFNTHFQKYIENYFDYMILKTV